MSDFKIQSAEMLGQKCLKISITDGSVIVDYDGAERIAEAMIDALKSMKELTE